ncbi:MAG TPA: hypothetical protein P5200_14155 [Tenuifilaceae bacterium]|nr:hypothetical protein [Tenuifilaceae bacterium]
MKIERFEDIEIWKDAKPLGVNRLTFGVWRCCKRLRIQKEYVNENKTTARMKIERFEDLEIWKDAKPVASFLVSGFEYVKDKYYLQNEN